MNKRLLAGLGQSSITPLIAPSGRKFWRHESGKGTVMEYFWQSKIRQALILDSTFRSFSQFAPSSVQNTEMPDAKDKNSNNNNFINGEWNETTPQACESINDSQLDSLWGNLNNQNTSTECSNYWFNSGGTFTALNKCKEIKIKEKPCVIPNIQLLQRIYCDAVFLDSLDPTAKSNDQFCFSNYWHPQNQNWFNGQYAWSTTEYGTSLCRILSANGTCGFDDVSRVDVVIPILEL